MAPQKLDQLRVIVEADSTMFIVSVQELALGIAIVSSVAILQDTENEF